ncbi:Ig-like domain-containing protein [Sphingomonas sp.]|jgi:VCBS repeat-containing protein|uniref:Ig-like domain-containing protein n=1 Tax=Sphingomonas sp. TaxID=28214 RepID=UPI002ED792DB
MATYNGTNGDDVINAAAGSNTINAGNGNNRVTATGTGSQTVTAGTGNDTITTGDGSDSINAGAGNNVINAGNGNNNVTTLGGNDTITAGSGDDKIDAGDGVNVVNAGDGKNDIQTGSGADTITTGSGDDKIDAGDGANLILAGSGRNDVRAGSGADTITTGSGDDKIDSGAGNDFVNAGGGDDNIKLGAGDDIARHVVSDNLTAKDNYTGEDGVDTLQLVLTAAQAADSAILADIQRFRAHLASGSNGQFSFSAFDLKAHKFEKLDLVAPVDAKNDTASVSEDGQTTIAVLANDVDILAADSSALRVISYDAAGLPGTLTLNNNVFTFVPGAPYQNLALGQTATVSFNYTMGDDQGYTDTATVTLTITGANDGPVAIVDVVSITENQSVTVDVLANDIDVDNGYVLTLVSANAPTGQGIATVVNNNLVFTPGANFDHLAAGATQAVTVTYAMRDQHGATSSSTLTVTVTGTNDGPVAVADTAAGTENQTLTIDVLANDTDVDDGHVFALVSASAPAGYGTASVAANQLVFTPGAAFDHLAIGATAVVTLAYTMRDEHGAQSSSTVTVTVTGTNDGPVAVADTAAGAENQALTIDVLANDTDLDDGHVFTLVSANAPSGQGVASVVDNRLVFTPGTSFDDLAAGATETVIVSYTMRDQHGAQSTSTLTLTVTGTNDGPVAVADTAAGTENQTLTIDVLANDTDVDSGHAFTLISVSAPSGQGVASVVDNKLVFTPGTSFDDLAAGATEIVTVSYIMADEHGAQSNSTVTITVTGTNDGPVAVADAAAGTENQTLTIDVLANDTDVDTGHVFTLVSASAPAGYGAASVVANQLVFNPGADFDHLALGATAVITLAYTMADEHGAQSSSTVTVTITGTNDGPVAVADTAATTENAAITVNVLANDTDVDNGAVFTLLSASAPSGKGVATISGNQLVFTPGTDFDHLAAGATEVITVLYAMSDGQGAESASTLTVTITGTNDGPVAVADTAAGTENQALTIDVLANDTDLDDGHVFTLLSASAPSGSGVASVMGNRLVFTPGIAFDHLAAGATAVVTLAYMMADEHGAQSSSTVTVTVTGTNDGPVAVADAAAATENQALTIDVLANDTDVDDAHVFTLLGAAAPSGSGTASVTNNQLVFTPGTDFDHLAPGATQTVVVSYTMADEHGAQSTSTATITVTGTNDTPTVTSGAAAARGTVIEAGNADDGSALAGTSSATGTLTAADVDDGAALTWSGNANGTYGSFAIGANGQWTYALDNSRSATQALREGQTVTESFTTTVRDQFGAAATQTVQITVNGTNDAPVIVPGGGVSGNGSGSYALPSNVHNHSMAAAVSLDGLLSLSSNGNIENSTTVPHVTVSAVADGQTDWYSFTVPSGATVTLDVDGAAFDTWLTLYNSSGTALAVSDDAGGDPGSTSGLDSYISTQLTAGTYYIQMARFPSASSASGSYNFHLSIAGGTGASYTDTLVESGHLDNGSVVAGDAAGSGLARSTDVDAGATATWSGTANGAYGSFAIATNGAWTYSLDNSRAATQALDEGQTVTETFTITVTDEFGAIATQPVVVTITGTNDRPVAVADTGATTENQALTIDVLANDTDVDGSAFTLVSASAPSGQGNAAVVANQLVFTPGTAFDHLAAGAVQVVTLSYVMRDEFGATSTANVAVTVTGTNDGPVAVVDTAAGTENQTLTIDVLANDTDVDDGHVFTLLGASAPEGSGLAAIVNNRLVFAPGADFDHLAAGVTQTVTLTYTMRDEHGATSASTVTVTVTGTNDAPVASFDAATTSENAAVTIDVLANDTDLDDNHVLTVTAAMVAPAQGSVAIVANRLVYTPANFDHLAVGASEAVTIFYSISDAQGGQSAATVTVTVTGANDAPVAVADTAASTENQILAVDVLANDTDVDDGAVFTLVSASAPAAHGVASVLNNQLVFTPGTDFDHLAAGATEVVTVSYTMRDGQGAESVSTATITITGTNDAPVAIADTANATEDSVVTGSVASNDSDIDDGATRSFALDAPVPGLTLNTDGSYSFDASNVVYQDLALGQLLTVAASYTVTDDKGATAASTLTLTLTGTNDGPVAVADVAAGTENQTLTVDVLANDTDVDSGHAFTLISVSAPSGQGVASVVDNKLVFTPGTSFDDLASGATETVIVSYTMRDEHGAQSNSTVTVTVTGTNDGPVAVADTAAGTENQTLTIDVLANDTDVDTGHVFTLVSANAPSGQGVASVVDNKLVFTPGTNFDDLAAGATEIVTVSYIMADEHGAQSSSTVTITVTGTNDGPVAVADTAAGTENQTLTIDVLANDTDVDTGHVFTLVSATAPSGQGTASIVSNQLVFTPGADFDNLAAGATETVIVSYTMADEHGSQSVSTATITVTGTNDAPVVSGAVTGAATEDGSAVGLNGLANASDVDDGAVLAITPPATLPAGVSFSAGTGVFTLDPANAVFQSLAMGATTIVTVNYSVTDGTASVPASASWTVTGTNDLPVVTSNAAAAAGSVVEAGSSVAGTATATGALASSDVDTGATASWSGTVNGTYGSFAISAAGVWTYTLDNSRAATEALAPGQTVTETFTATVTDDKGGTAQQTITIQVAGSEDNRAPTAADVSLSGTSGSLGGSGVAIAPYNNGSGMIFTRLIDTNGDGVADTPDAPSTLSGGYGTGLATGDIDGDGDVDMVSINGSQVWTYSNVGDTDADGRVDFVSTMVSQSGNGSQDIGLTDLNGDGKLDIVYSSYGSLTELINQGDSDADGVIEDFSSRSIATNGSNGYTYGIATGDLDGDGLSDIVIPNYEANWYGGQAVTVMFNRGDTDGDGQINYVNQGLNPGTMSAMGASIGDLNGDGKADLVISRWDYQGVQVMMGRGDTNGDGQIEFGVSNITINDYVMETTLADLDGDGDLDLSSSGANGYVYLSLNQGDTDADGNLNFTTTSYYTGYGSYGLAVTDLDADGDLDVFVPNQGGYWYGNTAAYLNNLGDTNGDGVVEFSVVPLSNIPSAWDAEPLDVGIGGGSGAREDGPIVTGSFVGDDVDAGDAANLTFEVLTQPGEGSVVNNGDGTFGFNPGADFQDLAQGESRTVTFTYRAVDSHGAGSQPATVTVSVAGTNDAPVSTSTPAARVGSVTEAGDLDNGTDVAGTPSTTGTLSASDADNGASLTWSLPASGGNGTYGTFALTNAGAWTYTLDNSRAATQGLAEGQSVTETFTVRVTDEKGGFATEQVTITVNGTNDAPVAVADAGPGVIGATAIGPEFQVNSTTYQSQYQSSITGLANGGFVVTWTDQSNGQNGDWANISAQLYNAAGQRVGNEFRINATTTNGQYEPSTTALASGGFVVTWQDDSQQFGDNSSLATIAQIFDASGQRVGSEFRVNTATTHAQYQAEVTALASGGFVVTYADQSPHNNGGQEYTNINLQIFNASGQRVGGEIVANLTTIYDQYEPTITSLSDGGFVIAWRDSSQQGGDTDTGIRAQRFNASGARVGSEILVNTTTQGYQGEPAMTALSNGGFVVTWQTQGTGNNQDYENVMGQVFNAQGQRVGGEFQANSVVVGSQYQSAITALPNGGFVITWIDNSAHYNNNNGSTDYSDIRAQVFDGSGQAVGNEFVVNSFRNYDQSEPAITTLANGTIVISWTDNSGQNGDNSGGAIHAQIFSFLTYPENDPITFDVLANDTDIDAGAVLTLTSVSVPNGRGTVSIVDNKVVYNPGTVFDHLAARDTESVTVTYTMRDQFGATSGSTLTITMTGTNDAPVVSGPVTGTAIEDGASSTLDAFANTSDVDDATIFTAVLPSTLPSGVTYNAATHSFTLNPGAAAYQSLAPGQTTTVTVNYGITDGIATTPAIASWTVTGTYDGPAVSGNSTATVAEDGAASTISGLARASAIDSGSTVSVTNVPATLPAGVTYNAATQSFTLDTANAAYQSLATGATTTVTVSYGVTDGTTTVPTAIVWTVTGTNDTPTVSGAVTGAATEDGASVTLSALTGAADVDTGTTLSVTSIGALPAGVTYNAGTQSFTLDPANAAYQSLAAGAMNTVTVNYRVSDGAASVAQTASWVVTGTNDAPVVSGAATGTATEDGASSVINARAQASDVDAGTTLTVTDVPTTLPAGVTYNAANQTFSLNPADAAYQSLAAGATTVVTVSYSVSDGTTSTPASARWTITGTNDAPSGAGATLSVNEDVPLTLTAANFGFSDAEGNALSAVVITTLPSNGVLRLNGTAVTAGAVVSVGAINAGQLIFTPAANASGSGHGNFTFQVRDNGGTANGGQDTDQSPNTLIINVNPVNDAPVGINTTVVVLEDTTYTLARADFGFTDVEGNALLAVKIAALPTGSLRLNGTAVTVNQVITVADIDAGKLTWIHVPNATTSAAFSFQVQDDGGTANGGVDLDQSSNGLTFQTTPVNDAPVGADRTITATEDTALTLTTANFAFTDTESNALASVTITTVPAAGTLALNGVAITAGQLVTAADITAGKLVFTPATNANGAGYASFTYQVQDNGGTANGGQDTDQSPNTMTINVTAVNDPVTDLSMAVNPVPENVPSVVVGVLSATDADVADTFTYSIRPGLDGALFTIVGNELRVGGTGLDYEQATTRQVTVRATDAAGSFYDRVFTIQVLDSNEITLTTGSDVANAGATNDQVLANSLTLNTGDQITTGGGTDELLLFGGGAFNLSTLAAYSGIETVRLINLTANTATLTLKAGVQNDVVVSGTGNTTTILNNLASTFTGADGADTVTAGTGNVVINTGNGNDIVTTGSGTASVNTGSGFDTVTTGAGAATVLTGDSNDTVTLGTGTATVDTGTQDDTVNHNGGAATIETGQGNDVIRLGSGLATVLAGTDQDTILYDQNGFNAAQTIDGGLGTDTLQVNGIRDLTGATLTNLETLSAQGQVTMTAAQLAQFTTITGSTAGRVTIADATLDWTGKTLINATLYSTNATGTLFKVSSATAALQIYGGNGNDTVQVVGAALTADQRDYLFAVSSIETLIDSSGTYAAPVSGGNLIRLTTGTDTVVADPGDVTVNATALTLNAADVLAGGAGTDTLAIYGTGTFNLNSFNVTGFEEVKLVNNTTTTVSLTLKTNETTNITATGTGGVTALLNNMASTVTLAGGGDTVQNGTGTATISTGANGDTVFMNSSGGGTIDTGIGNDNVYLGTGLVTVDMGADTDQLRLDQYGFNASSSVNGGSGFDYLYLFGNRDLTATSISNFEYLSTSGDIRITTAQLAQFQQFGGSGWQSKVTFGEALVDLTNKSVSNAYFASFNATGTTFKVNSAAMATAVQGGAGNDTIDAATITLSAADREFIFATSAVETIIDFSGTYTAPAATPGTIKLTTGNDTLPALPDSQTIIATSATLTNGDNLAAGATGTDELKLYGGGTFNFGALAGFSGFELITLMNNSVNSATVYFRSGVTTTFVSNSNTQVDVFASDSTSTITCGNGSDYIRLANGNSTINTGNSTDVVWMQGTGTANVNMGAGNDELHLGNGIAVADMGANDDYVRDTYGFAAGSVLDAGTGFDYFRIIGTRDLTTITLSNFEYLSLDSTTATVKMSAAQVAQFTYVYGQTGSKITTADAVFDLSGKNTGTVSFLSENAAGTLFKVSNSAAGFQVVGGSGQDGIQAVGFTFTLDQRTALLNGASVEYIIEGNTIYGGSGNNTLTGTAAANTIYGNGGDDTVDGAAGVDSLYGGDGNDVFVFRFGESDGDHVLDFSGNGAGIGDSLQFVGYGAGATFTQIDATHWQVNYNAGASHDVITFDNAPAINTADFTFV